MLFYLRAFYGGGEGDKKVRAVPIYFRELKD